MNSKTVSSDTWHTYIPTLKILILLKSAQILCYSLSNGMFKTLKKATLRGKNNGQMAISRFQHTIKHTWFELF